MFIGREKELKYLETCYHKTGDQITVVYGQKGIGKTTLLQHFMEGKEAFYYEAIPCSDRQQRIYMANRIKEMGLEISDIPRFQEIFSLLEIRKGKKIILIIDEFHNLCKTEYGFFDDLFQFLYRIEKKNDVFIILCSSSIGWVENTLESKAGELWGEICESYKINERSTR